MWEENGHHDLLIESGIFKLLPDRNGWKVNGHSLQIRTDDRLWPELDVAFDWQPVFGIGGGPSRLTPLIKHLSASITLDEVMEDNTIKRASINRTCQHIGVLTACIPITALCFLQLGH